MNFSHLFCIDGGNSLISSLDLGLRGEKWHWLHSRKWSGQHGCVLWRRAAVSIWYGKGHRKQKRCFILFNGFYSAHVVMLCGIYSVFIYLFCFSKNFLAHLHRSEGVGMLTYRHSETHLVSKKWTSLSHQNNFNFLMLQ